MKRSSAEPQLTVSNSSNTVQTLEGQAHPSALLEKGATMPRVQFVPHNREIDVQEGTTLIRAALEAGVHINASCGGTGICGKCRVLVESGEVQGGINEKLSAADQQQGYCLACQATVQSDVKIRVPVESEMDAAVLNVQASPRRTAHIQQVDLQDFKEKGLFLPPVEKKYLQMAPPSGEDNSSDVTRVVNALKREHDEHRLEVGLYLIRKLLDVLREDAF